VVLREVTVARPDKDAPLYLVTNDFDRPAAEIARLYKERWEIELLFKWLKQNLKIRRFLGRSENAVRTQIYVALIAFMLLRILHQTAARCAKTSTALLLAQIKIGLFRPLDLRKTHKPPPRPPCRRAPHPQLNLALQ
jgi:IS4 transposase